MHSKLEILILAAGKGTRMRSNLPKVLHKLAANPCWTRGAQCPALGATRPAWSTALVASGAQALADDKLTFVLQAEPARHRSRSATGAACAGRRQRDAGAVRRCAADAHRHPATAGDGGAGWQAGVADGDVADPTGYGRIVREHGKVTRIVEHKDATDAERAIAEVNPASSRWRPGISNNGSPR